MRRGRPVVPGIGSCDPYGCRVQRCPAASGPCLRGSNSPESSRFRGGDAATPGGEAFGTRGIASLLDRGADIDATDGTGSQALDLAVWSRKRLPASNDFHIARLLLSRGATCDLTIAAALGDLDRVTALLDQNPACLREVRPNGKRALSAAVKFGHREIARLLLDRGADPNWPESDAPRGASLHAAARTGDRELVELLLAHGADPNSHVDSAGNAVYAARTPELRALLMARGGTLDPYDLVWLDEDDEVMRRVTEDPSSAELGCGGVFTAVCTRGKQDLLLRLLDAGIRVPPVVTGCHSYLIENIEMLRILLASGINPDLPNWQRRTFLHDLCSGGKRGQTQRMQSSARGSCSTRAPRSQPETRSTVRHRSHGRPNEHAGNGGVSARRGAPTNLPDDPPWATPSGVGRAEGTRRGRRDPPEAWRRQIDLTGSLASLVYRDACRSILLEEKTRAIFPRIRLRAA